jgi:ubiquinol-cytochrome c reductase cytochrome b subunit
MNINMIRHYSTTILLNPVYNIGFCISLYIMIQIITGYLLASNYIAHTILSFDIIHNVIMRELDTGWLLRFNHMNGCAFLFLMLYLHMIRTIYHSSIHKTSLWLLGIGMYIILCGIAFTGYSLVYGQMSLWAIVVICSLVTAIPFVGNKLLVFIWGGNLVTSVTLQRIFCLHYILPLILILGIIFHLYLLHNVNSTGDAYFISHRYDRVNFYPLLLIRDLFIGSCIQLLYTIVVYWYSDLFGAPDNYVLANPLVTPAEIMPEFYLLPFYALIRAIPHKVLGIICMVLFLLCLITTDNSDLCIIFGNIHIHFHIHILHRALLALLLLDFILASKLCLMVNHFPSFYLVVIGNIMYILYSIILTFILLCYLSCSYLSSINTLLGI